MKHLPIIMVAPHAHSKVDKFYRNRFELSDYEIWKNSDPYTDRLSEFTCASFKHISKNSRLICDQNRAPHIEDAFRGYDFFDKKVFKKGRALTPDEKWELILGYWYPFHNNIINSIKTLDEQNAKAILIVDYHNTSGDHTIGRTNSYMPNMIFSNLGSEIDVEEPSKKNVISIPYKYLLHLRNFVSEKLCISAEINKIYRGGYNLHWYTQLKDILDIKAHVFSIQIEYNLDNIYNPITKKLDKKALKIMQKCLNSGLTDMYEEILKNI